jgi:deoxycytidine triphosphate deaminase
VSQLSAQSIRALCVGTNRPLVTPFVEERTVKNGKSYGLSAASYDCRIDHDLVLGVNPAHIIARSIVERWPDESLREILLANPPMSALAYTMEDFWIPANVSGAVCDKSTYARVFVSAFNTFFDPGFHGNGTLELVNLGTSHVRYEKGDPVCQMLFQWLDKATDRPYNGKYQHQEKGAHGPIYEKDGFGEKVAASPSR